MWWRHELQEYLSKRQSTLPTDNDKEILYLETIRQMSTDLLGTTRQPCGDKPIDSRIIGVSLCSEWETRQRTKTDRRVERQKIDIHYHLHYDHQCLYQKEVFREGWEVNRVNENQCQ